MRMRKKKHGIERIEACSGFLIKNERISDEIFKEIFPNAENSKLYLEIGCGKGDFVLGMSQKHPDDCFIALERIADVAMLAMEKCKLNERDNVKFIIGDIAKLWEMFADSSVDGIYLNFSDPWPKAKHYKRRLTYKTFLEQYKRILKPNGAVFFKTDNRGLFDFSLEQFAECGFETDNLTYDLHNSVFAADNVMTEYEKNFSQKGFAINSVEARCNQLT